MSMNVKRPIHRLYRRMCCVKYASARPIHVVWINQTHNYGDSVEERITGQSRLNLGAKVLMAGLTNDPGQKDLLSFISHAFWQYMAYIKRHFRRLPLTLYTAIRNRKLGIGFLAHLLRCAFYRLGGCQELGQQGKPCFSARLVSLCARIGLDT